MANFLVVGGAGYVGSHQVLYLKECGHQVTVLDNLVRGHREMALGDDFISGDLRDKDLLDHVLSEGQFDAVFHFGAFAYVGESVEEPAKYYRNNVSNTLNLLESIKEHGLSYLIFSSTCATFGEPREVPIREEAQQAPLNPYGRSKLMVEEILKDFGQAYGLKSAVLRYFNAAGADPEARIGEDHDPETHLIPLALDTAMGRRQKLYVYGGDYPTRDGTCVRDYIHVMDLASAHLLAYERMRETGRSVTYNLGTGTGYSVREVVDIARQVIGKDIPVEVVGRRPGDAAQLVADSDRARQELQWEPQYPQLEAIVRHAWNWHKRRFSRSSATEVAR